MTPLQEKLLELMKEVDEICRSNGIVYYLHAGNALGAVRHRGFIPWDDDIDLIITRDNWEKFLNVCNSNPRENRALVCRENNPEHSYLFARYVDTTTSYAFRWKAFNTGAEGIGVDFCIFDFISDDPVQQDKYRKWMILSGELVGRRLVVNPNGDLRLYQGIKFLEKFLGKSRIEKIVNRKMRQYAVDDGPCCIPWTPHSFFPWIRSSEFLREPEEVELEGCKFYAPTNTVGFVRAVYGDDWMKMPPPANRRTHPYCGDVNISYGEVEKDAQRWVNVKKYDMCYTKQKPLLVRAAFHENKIKRIDAIYRCQAYAMEFNTQCQENPLDFAQMLATGRYPELSDFFAPYISEQFGEYRKLDVATCRLTVEYAAPYVIHIPEDALHTVCMLLVLRGEYFHAQRILDMHFGENGIRPERFRPVQELIDASRQASIAFYDEKNIEKAAGIAEQWLKQYPHHLDFLYLHFRQMLTQHHDPSGLTELLGMVNAEFCFHPDSVMLTRILADIQLQLGNRDEAVMMYRKVLASSCDGVLNLEVADILNGLGETYDGGSLAEECPASAGSVSVLQEKTLALLQEIDHICQKEGIPYFLGPALTKLAIHRRGIREGSFANQIILRPQDRARFLDAVQRDKPAGRIVDCMETNPDYADFTVHYCDSQSILFAYKDAGLYGCNGICIEILFVCPSQSGMRHKLSRVLVAATEASAATGVFSNTHARKEAMGILGRVAGILLGKRNAKKLFWKIAYAPSRSADVILGKIKSYRTSWCMLPALHFNEHNTAYLNGIPFAIPRHHARYVVAAGSEQYANLNNKNRYIFLPHVANGDMFPRVKLFRQRAKASCHVDRLHERGRQYSAYIIRGWEIFLRSLIRIKLQQQYLPQKERILQLYHEGNYVELNIVLGEYIKQMKIFARKKLPVYFDSEIFRITWELMERNGDGAIVEQSLGKIPPAHLASGRMERKHGHAMHAVTTVDTLDEVLAYIRPDKEKCLYLYLDLTMYGLTSPHVRAWCDRDADGLRMVVMQYHDSFQIYSNRDFDNIDGVLRLVEICHPRCISARREIIEALHQALPQYQVEYGVVLRHGSPHSKEKLESILNASGVEITLAVEADAGEIARLICLDRELGAPYTVEGLTEELAERIRNGTGRSLIVRDGGKIVAHAATYAENDEFAISSGMIVDPQYRNSEYFYLLNAAIELIGQSEKKPIYGMAIGDKLQKVFRRTGCSVVSHYGKLTLPEKDQND